MRTKMLDRLYVIDLDREKADSLYTSLSANKSGHILFIRTPLSEMSIFTTTVPTNFIII